MGFLCSLRLHFEDRSNTSQKYSIKKVENEETYYETASQSYKVNQLENSLDPVLVIYQVRVNVFNKNANMP